MNSSFQGRKGFCLDPELPFFLLEKARCCLSEGLGEDLWVLKVTFDLIVDYSSVESFIQSKSGLAVLWRTGKTITEALP